jgi:ATP-dependent DNA helicase RecQ
MCGTERRKHNNAFANNNNVVVDLTDECSAKPADMESNRSRRRRLEGMLNGQKSRINDGNNGAKFSSENDAIDVDLGNSDDDRHGSDKAKKGINDALTNNNTTDNIIGPLQIQNKSESNRSAMNNHDSGKRKSKNKSKDVPKRARLTDFYSQKSTQQQPSLESLMDRATYILQSIFKLRSLRPLQQKAIQGCLSRKSQIVIMATGGGKSLCYQLPALVGGNNFNHQVNAKNSSVTIVVCPLIALMIDQVNNLMKKGVRTAACWSSSHSAKDKAHIMKRLSIEKSSSKSSKTTAENNNVDLTPIQILYVTPELIETERFRGVLMKLHDTNRLFSFAVDEAHCLSTWGHDFRPAYRKLTWIRETFPDVPIMACTGTATEQVINDVRDTLSFGKDVPCHLGTFNRQNINYEVRFKDSLNTQPQGAITDLVNEVKKQHAAAERAKQPCAGIIYVHKREDCQSLAMQISKSTGIVAAAYHAGLKDKERDEAQRKWCDGTIKVVVATVVSM